MDSNLIIVVAAVVAVLVYAIVRISTQHGRDQLKQEIVEAKEANEKIAEKVDAEIKNATRDERSAAGDEWVRPSSKGKNSGQ